MDRHLLLSLLLCNCLLYADAAGADNAQARAIMEKVDNRDDGDNATSEMTMILIDTRGQERIRSLRTFTRDQGRDMQRLLYFLQPADLRGTGLLTYDYHDADQDDDQWLYLPALRKSRRIAAADRSGSFMGSDFSYADMTKRDPASYDFELIREEEIDGHRTWLIEATPRSQKIIDETGYTKALQFVRQDIDMMVRAVYWTKEGKKLKYFEVRQLQQIDGIWVPVEMQMTTRHGDKVLHRTVLRQSNIHFNENLPADRFSVRQLEKGL